MKESIHSEKTYSPYWQVSRALVEARVVVSKMCNKEQVLLL
jgi:hypothetical protein